MTECTVHQAAEAFIGYLRESGKKERTLYTYRKVSIHRNSIDTGKMRRSSLDPTFLLA